MKPLHMGLLVLGAAVAGGLAVKMTEPQAFPPPPLKSAPGATPPMENPKPATAPPPVLKTIPIPPAAAEPASIVRNTTERKITASPADASTSAPPPVYSEPPHTRPTPFPVPPKQSPEQIAIAKPAQLPGLYQRPPEPAQQTPAQNTPLVQQVEEPQPPRQVTLQPGATIVARMLETLSSDRVSAGDAFSASLAEPLVIDGLVIAERGARVDGRVVSAERPARMNGRSEIQLALSNITTADGQRIAISTDPWIKTGVGSGSSQAEEIGGGAALGAIIGAIAGGGKGAAIGAGVGGGAGIGTAIATKAKPVTVPTESVIRFRVKARVTITERQL